jgi:two-component system response regulator VicR
MAKILIVEDERSVRQALRFELEDEGHEVIDASDFPEAVSAYNAFECDIVISDLFISQGDGIQLLKMVQDGKKNVPFIAITAFPDSKMAFQARNLLKDRLFVKPFFALELKAKISQLLQATESTMAI